MTDQTTGKDGTCFLAGVAAWKLNVGGGAAVFLVVRNGAGIVAVFHGELIQTMIDQSTGIGRG